MKVEVGGISCKWDRPSLSVEPCAPKARFKTTRYGRYQIAEAEKTLLDWIYLKLQTGIEPALDELEFGNLSRRTLVEYAQRFPSTVYKHLLPALATGTFAT